MLEVAMTKAGFDSVSVLHRPQLCWIYRNWLREQRAAQGKLPADRQDEDHAVSEWVADRKLSRE